MLAKINCLRRIWPPRSKKNNLKKFMRRNMKKSTISHPIRNFQGIKNLKQSMTMNRNSPSPLAGGTKIFLVIFPSTAFPRSLKSDRPKSISASKKISPVKYSSSQSSTTTWMSAKIKKKKRRGRRKCKREFEQICFCRKTLSNSWNPISTENPNDIYGIVERKSINWSQNLLQEILQLPNRFCIRILVMDKAVNRFVHQLEALVGELWLIGRFYQQFW